jgi:hypothetical protein
MKRMARRLLPVLAVALAVLFGSKALWPAWFAVMGATGARAIGLVASLSKLTALACGFAFARRCVRALDEEDAVRPAWIFVGRWFACFLVGQLILSAYAEILVVTPPDPSVGDAFFLFGYVWVFLAIRRFIALYRASGFPLGRPRDHALIAVGATVVFAATAIVVLWPVAVAPAPLLERCVNLAYPVLDFILLVPTLVLVRVTVPFHGGSVGGVWAAFLAGIVFFTVGDILFAVEVGKLSPMVDLLFIFGYGFSAYGALRQLDVVRG